MRSQRVHGGIKRCSAAAGAKDKIVRRERAQIMVRGIQHVGGADQTQVPGSNIESRIWNSQGACPVRTRHKAQAVISIQHDGSASTDIDITCRRNDDTGVKSCADDNCPGACAQVSGNPQEYLSTRVDNTGVRQRAGTKIDFQGFAGTCGKTRDVTDVGLRAQ